MRACYCASVKYFAHADARWHKLDEEEWNDDITTSPNPNPNTSPNPDPNPNPNPNANPNPNPNPNPNQERGRVALPSSGEPITPWLRLVRSGGLGLGLRSLTVH